MSRDPLEGLLGHSGRDPGCDAAFDQFHRYCDAVLRGEDVERQFPEFMNHLRNCPGCREDADGLLAALREMESDSS